MLWPDDRSIRGSEWPRCCMATGPHPSFTHDSSQPTAPPSSVFTWEEREVTRVCPSSCHVHFLSSDLTVLCAPVCLRRCGSVAHGVCFCVCLLSVHLKHVEVKWFWQPFLTAARLIISAELSSSQNPKSLKENCCFSDYLLYKNNRFHPIRFFENQFLLITEMKRFWRVRGCSEVLGDCIERPEAAAEDTRQLA